MLDSYHFTLYEDVSDLVASQNNLISIPLDLLKDKGLLNLEAIEHCAIKKIPYLLIKSGTKLKEYQLQLTIDDNRASEVADKEKYFNYLLFSSGNTRYLILTQFPVYICNNSGKTIETI
jgi:hypothetical protein